MRLVGFDAETALVGQGRKAPPLVCYATSTGGVRRWDDKAELFELWHDAAEGRARIVAQNAPFDAAVCMAQYPELIPVVFRAYDRGAVSDIMIRELLIDIESGGRPQRKGLDRIADKYLGITINKGDDTWRKRYWDLRDSPITEWPAAAVDYARTDADILLPLWHAQEKASIHADALDNEPAQCRGHLALHLMATWGLKTDTQHVDVMRQEMETNNERRKYLLQNTIPLTADGRPLLDKKGRERPIIRAAGSVDTEALVTYLESAGVSLPKTPTGKPSLKAEHLEGLDDEVLVAYHELKRDTKMLNTYLDKYATGLVQCTVNPILANGRSSLSSPSLQNLPRTGSIRESFIPRDGTVLCAIDYDGIELRTLAQVCLWHVGHSRMADAFRANPDADLHTMFAASLLGVSAHEANELKQNRDPRIKDARQRAKACNFGFPGGMGVTRFVEAQRMQGAHYTETEARRLKNLYLEQWPEMTDYFSSVGELTSSGPATMRCYVSGRYRGSASFCEVANGYFSSLMADGSKHATYEIVKQCYADPSSPLYGTRVVNAVHDEVIMELDSDAAHEQAHHARDIFCGVMQEIYTPDIPIMAEPALMTRWYKDAEPRYENGRLVPWK